MSSVFEACSSCGAGSGCTCYLQGRLAPWRCPGGSRRWWLLAYNHQLLLAPAEQSRGYCTCNRHRPCAEIVPVRLERQHLQTLRRGAHDPGLGRHELLPPLRTCNPCQRYVAAHNNVRGSLAWAANQATRNICWRVEWKRNLGPPAAAWAIWPVWAPQMWTWRLNLTRVRDREKQRCDVNSRSASLNAWTGKLFKQERNHFICLNPFF
jgi:hypothetical protein